jgi:Peptidase A4 family
MISGLKRTAAGCALISASALVCLAPALAQASARPDAHGNVVHIVKPGVRANASQSSNWFGYNQGTLEQGGEQFHSVTGDWTVPRARQHTKGTAAASSTWIGIGGGCVDADCAVGDSTLIQVGTEQDVSARGKRSYSAWWEIIPGPAITIGKLKVRPGDQMRASISERVEGSEMWRITLRNLTRHRKFSTTVPYTSTHATAEWIEETPITIGTDTGVAALPKLSRTTFDRARVNGAPARLKPSERIVLADGDKVIGRPSWPGQEDGFALCTWTKRCRPPR